LTNKKKENIGNEINV